MRTSTAVIVGLIIIVLGALAAWGSRKTAPSSPHTSGAAPTAVVEATRSTHRPADADRSAAPSAPPSITPAPGAAVPQAGARLDLRTIRACHDALLNKKALEQQDGCEGIPPEQASVAGACRNQQARAARQIAEATAAAAPCPADLLRASAYYDAIKTLALSGDTAAQRCFIQGYFASAAQEGEESRIREDQMSEYPRLANQFIDQAFERGDWSVVRWLARARIGLQDGMLRTAYPFGSEYPVTAYRMNYLLMLGNHRSFQKSVDPRQFVETAKSTARLTASEIRDAEAWAHEMFDQHFNGSQEGADVTQLCEHS